MGKPMYIAFISSEENIKNLEAQEFPERHYTPGGILIKPYDITSWSLPLHRYVTSHEIDTRSKELEAKLSVIEGEYDLSEPLEMEVHAMVVPVSANESYRAAFNALELGLKVERLKEAVEIKAVSYGKGSFIIYHDPKKKGDWEAVLEALPFQPGLISNKRTLKSVSLELPRIALVETYFHDMDRRVIGTYPEKEILMSGYASNEEKMGNQVAMIWMKKGKGQFVFYGFNPQFRASTQTSFKLLFNAILLDKME